MIAPTLQTERLTMRMPQTRDFEIFAEFRASSRVEKMGGRETRSQAFANFCHIIGHWQFRGYGSWIVADKSTDAPLGLVGLYFPEDWPEPEVTWAVFEGSEGRGIAYEAAMETLRYTYGTLGWTSVISCTLAGNDRSVALAKRLGAKFERVHEHPDGFELNVWRHLPPEALS